MNDMTPCDNRDALIAYLYDECEPAERESIAAHVALCASCTEEIESLRDTRAHLGAWTPRSLPLGFQITRAESEEPAKVLRPAAWWRQPLPAWAQAAAAVVIFAAGMSVNGVSSSGEAPAAVAQAPASQPVQVTRPVDDMTVTRAEFARLEARLRSMESADVQLAARTGREIDQDELFARVSALVDDRIAQSERRTLRTNLTFARALDAQRATTARVGEMDEEILELKQAFRTVAPSMVQLTSFQGR